MRYLAVLTLMLPFAAAPLARAVGGKRFAILVGPHLVASAIGGWVGYGPFVRGALPVRETPELRDDYTLFHLLRARGVTYATADYWASYRLTLLFSERIVVVPKNDGEDRYAPYRRELEKAPVFAYVFDPGRSREDLGEAEKTLRAKYKDVEKTAAGGHTVFIVRR
jgi:glycosyltransferase involved in cell wall biosynthesis